MQALPRHGSGLLALAVALLPLTLQASEEELYFGELPVVASVSRLPQRQADAPASVTVIDRDIIKASGARDLSDVMRLVPGFQTFANNNDSPRVTYHGLADREQSSRIQVLVDGRSIFSPLFDGGVNWMLIPVALEDIERIEVIRGTNSTAQGSNAFQGVVNITTLVPELAQGFSLGMSHGSQGVRDYTVRYGGRLGEAGSYRVRYLSRSDDGLTDRDNWSDRAQQRLFDFRGDVGIDAGNNLQVDFGRMEYDAVQGKTNSLDPPLHEARQASTHLQLTWQHLTGAQSDWLLRYAFLEDVHQERYTGQSNLRLSNSVTLPIPYTIGAADGVGRRHEIEAQNRQGIGRDIRLVWGGSYRHDELYWPQYLYGIHSAGRNVSRLFGNLEWKVAPWLTTNFGTALEKDSLAGELPSYRASASFHLNPENTVRFGVMRGSRSGGILDYRADGRIIAALPNSLPPPYQALGGLTIGQRETLGNPGLGYERLDTVELGYLGEWKNLRMSLEARLFWEHLPNRWYTTGRLPDASICPATLLSNPNTLQVLNIYLQSMACSSVDQVSPVQNVHIRGAEYQWRWQPLDSTRLMLSQSFVKVTSDFIDGVLTSPVNRTANSTMQGLDELTEQSAPRRATSFLLMQKLPYGLDFSLSGVWVSRMKWTVHAAQYPYKRFDTRLGYPFRRGGLAGEVAVNVQSLNGAHGEYYADNEPSDRIVERRTWLSLRLDL